jgi:alkanesulfonate monooxygenase
MVASLGYLYGRRLYLNIVAGGFRNDLLALGDETPHDDRYHRAVEFTSIVKGLLSGPEPFTHEGVYYRVRQLRMTPPLPPELFPGILISGSSPAGMAAAEAIGATAIKYPMPPGEEEHELASGPVVDVGVRVGIVARPSDEGAWAIAHERFPEDRRGQITHQLAMKVSDSRWHQQLSTSAVPEESPYWLGPFQNYKTFCPYLVGGYDTVGQLLAQYIRLGFRTFVLDIPPDEEELHHTGRAFRHAVGEPID